MCELRGTAERKLNMITEQDTEIQEDQLTEPESSIVEITKHADKRLKERLGLPKSARSRITEKAFLKGKTHADARGKLKRYLDGCWLSYKTCNNVRLYSEHIWFFKGNRLITVYDIPNNMKAGI